MDEQTFDYVVIGSGFGGSVSAMRLTEKGYDVLILERGKRFDDEDFAHSNWNIFKSSWFPILGCFGIQQLTLFKDVMVLHGSGVGGGSLIYANVLMPPDDECFEAPEWHDLIDWKTTLRPHYDTARQMTGVTTNPNLTPADHIIKELAEERGRGDTFKRTQVAVFFGEPGAEGKTVSDPYFDGEGLARTGCIECGGCMVGCRYNAKNTLPKNYLHFAEKWGAEIRAESKVVDIKPLTDGQPDDARYEIIYERSTGLPFFKKKRIVRTRNIVVSAGVLGTLRLLLSCRDDTGSLPLLSKQLGNKVRTNSETIPGSTSRDSSVDYSKGVAITSVFALDDDTHIEPVRYPDGSSLVRMLATPMVSGKNNFLIQILKMTRYSIIHPIDMLRVKLFGRWAKSTTVLLIMQTKDSMLRLKLGRNPLTLFRRGLVSQVEPGQKISPDVEISHGFTRAFAEKTNGIPQDSVMEALFDIPTTAHILGGCPMGHSDEDGVIDVKSEVFNYPGLYVVDGSIMPANPGINPSLTIMALAEHAMSHVPDKDGVESVSRVKFGVEGVKV